MSNFVKIIKDRVKGFHKARLINPHVHWALLVQFSLMVSLLLIIFGFYILFKIRSEQIFQAIPETSENPPSLIKENLLETVNGEFKNKEIRSKEIKEGLIIFSDPS